MTVRNAPIVALPRSSWRSRLLCWCMRSRTRRPSHKHRGKGGHAGTVPKTVPNPEPLSAKTSPTSTKLGRENLDKTRKFPFVFGRR